MTSFHHTDRAFKSFVRISEILPWPGQEGTGLLTGELARLSQALLRSLTQRRSGSSKEITHNVLLFFLVAQVEVPEDKPSEHKRSITLP